MCQSGCANMRPARSAPTSRGPGLCSAASATLRESASATELNDPEPRPRPRRRAERRWRGAPRSRPPASGPVQQTPWRGAPRTSRSPAAARRGARATAAGPLVVGRPAASSAGGADRAAGGRVCLWRPARVARRPRCRRCRPNAAWGSRGRSPAAAAPPRRRRRPSARSAAAGPWPRRRKARRASSWTASTARGGGRRGTPGPGRRRRTSSPTPTCVLPSSLPAGSLACRQPI
mmetsp:Transcript_8497/g.24304  ORF Transcript_8497/g.24304 Transcript_8497/m.24304 type:complete len:233 (-) Transcript_8497:55-753(-)